MASLPGNIYRHRPLPALGDVAEEQVINELRRIEQWGLSVNLRWNETIHYPKADCVDGAIPYADCDAGEMVASPLVYREIGPIMGVPSVGCGCDILMDYAFAIGFAASSGTEIAGGIGLAGGALVLFGTTDVERWDDPLTRRPAAFGGSEVVIDAGTSMALKLPGAVPNQYGYTLGLAADGRTVVAIPNPPPDLHLSDASDSTGVPLSDGDNQTGWFNFPSDVAVQPDLLQVVVPGGTQAGLGKISCSVFVRNTSDRTGNVKLGFGSGGADPEAADTVAYIIPALFQGQLNAVFEFLMPVDLPADNAITVMLDVKGNHSQFALVSDGGHTMSTSITYS